MKAIVVEFMARSPLRTFKGYEYCVGFKRAFESLKSEKYRSFILATIAFVYSPNNEHFKVFDTHARDIYGKSHSKSSYENKIKRERVDSSVKHIWSSE